MKKAIKPSRDKAIKNIGQVKPWLANKTAEARKLGEHRTARAARRWGAPAGVSLVVFLLIGSYLVPQDTFQKAKNKLLRNPQDLEAQLTLAEKFLANHQFEEAEKILLLAQQNSELRIMNNELDRGVLGEQSNDKLEELWQKKIYSDPEDIKRLITAWEKIMEEKPNYRDGYLRLAYLNYLVYENDKAKENLEKAIEIDPNYELTKELAKILGD